MFVGVCTYTYMYMNIYMHKSTHLHLYANTHTQISIDIYIYICIQVCVCVCVHIHLRTYIFMYVHMCIYVFSTYIYIYIAYRYIKCVNWSSIRGVYLSNESTCSEWAPLNESSHHGCIFQMRVHVANERMALTKEVLRLGVGVSTSHYGLECLSQWVMAVSMSDTCTNESCFYQWVVLLSMSHGCINESCLYLSVIMGIPKRHTACGVPKISLLLTNDLITPCAPSNKSCLARAVCAHSLISAFPYLCTHIQCCSDVDNEGVITAKCLYESLYESL